MEAEHLWVYPECHDVGSESQSLCLHMKYEIKRKYMQWKYMSEKNLMIQILNSAMFL